MMKRGFLVCSLAAAIFATGSLAAAWPNKPPGDVVQNVTAYLSGEAMNSAWHVVSSRVMVGKQNGKDPAYQWYLSIYAPAGMSSKLAYRSPGMPKDTLLSKVTKVNGAQLYFPMQTVSIAGTGEFRQQGVQDVVIVTHESSADCGGSTVSVIGYDAASKSVGPRVQITNGCDLQATIAKNGSLQAIRLTGPYYSKTAPMCCPTKPHASAMLAYRNGSWSVTPNYFSISP